MSPPKQQCDLEISPFRVLLSSSSCPRSNKHRSTPQLVISFRTVPISFELFEIACPLIPHDSNHSSSVRQHEFSLRFARPQSRNFNNFFLFTTMPIFDSKITTHHFKRCNHSCRHLLSLIASRFTIIV
nr:hypothetical protein HmN_001032700 [Hymenolepis microstoma]